MKNSISILLIAGILLMLNILSNTLFHRFDLTQGKQYTLSKATKDIVRNLDDPVTVTAYFSEGLPPDYTKLRNDFREMLVEYNNLSKGMVAYEFVDPSSDPQLEQEITQQGVNPILFNTREKDQVTQKRGYMAAVLRLGESQEVIPIIHQGEGMEYTLTTTIKKLAVVDKPSIGFLQGHGEPGLAQMSQVYQALSILYNVENIDLEAEPSIPPRFRAVAIVAPRDSFPPNHFAKLDDYLGQGGQLLLALNRVEGNLQNLQGTEISTGLETWLANKGLIVEKSFAIDENHNPVTAMQQRQVGFMTVQQPVQIPFPYLPIITNFAEHQITKGLEQVIFQFVSPIRAAGDTSKVFTPIAWTSDRSGSINTPTYFDVNKQWTAADYPLSALPVAGILEGNLVGGAYSKIVVFGDGDFAITGQQQGRGQSQDNISLMVNAVDWLSDDTGLIELRTKGIATRPIDEEYLSDEAEGKRQMIKYLNFGLPILLILIYGFLRSQRQRNKRIQRMQERYV